MCDGLGRQFSYTCPNATLFQQRMLICDHWYMVNCSRSVEDYSANLRIGQKEMPFVDDSVSNPYHRTPRPDLLSHPSQSEYDIIYRTGRAQLGNKLNLVGADSEDKKSNDKKSFVSASTDEPSYSLPSHWSTQFERVQPATTSKPIGKISVPKKSDNDEPVHYKSSYKNTTPVFPKEVDVTTASPDDVGLLPPLPYQLLNKIPDSSVVNFKSDFKATTPVYPKFVNLVPDEVSLQPPLVVNFNSNFKATTPVYPKSVESTSLNPDELGILPPELKTNNTVIASSDIVVPTLSLDILPPPVDINFQPQQEISFDAEPPSKFYQPPKFLPDYTEEKVEDASVLNKRAGGLKTLSSDEWNNLRKQFLIPDYEFPLETATVPSYDTVLSSFDASSVKQK